MVYWTRKCRQLERKWSGKEISFEAVPKNSQRWRWRQVADCCRGGFQPPEMPTVGTHLRWITGCEDNDDWRQRQLCVPYCACTVVLRLLALCFLLCVFSYYVLRIQSNPFNFTLQGLLHDIKRSECQQSIICATSSYYCKRKCLHAAT